MRKSYKYVGSEEWKPEKANMRTKQWKNWGGQKLEKLERLEASSEEKVERAREQCVERYFPIFPLKRLS